MSVAAGSPRAKKLRLLGGFALGAIGFAFVVRLMLRQRDALSGALDALRPWPLVASVLLLGLTFWMAAVAWRWVIRWMGQPAPGVGRLLSVWMLSGIARYVPGKVWQFLAAAALAQHAQMNARSLVASVLVYSGLSLTAAGVIAALSLPIVFGVSTLTIALMLAGIMVGVVAVHPRVIGSALRLSNRALRDQPATWSGTWVHGIALMLYASAAWVIYGFAFHLLANSLAGVSITHAPALIGISAIAFVAGQIAFIIPAGLGVRELAFAQLLTPLLGPAHALLLAVAARVWVAGVEVLGVIVAVAADRLLGEPLSQPQNGPPHAKTNRSEA